MWPGIENLPANFLAPVNRASMTPPYFSGHVGLPERRCVVTQGLGSADGHDNVAAVPEVLDRSRLCVVTFAA